MNLNVGQLCRKHLAGEVGWVVKLLREFSKGKVRLVIMTSTLDTLRTDGRIVFSFPEKALPHADEASFTAFVKAEWTARQSLFSQQDAEALALEVDSSWWSRNRDRILAQVDAG